MLPQNSNYAIYAKLSNGFNFELNYVKIQRSVYCNNNKPRTAKVGPIYEAENCKRRDPLGLVELQLVTNNENLKGDSCENLKKIPIKKSKIRFLNSVTVPENVKGDPLGLLTSIVLQNIKTNEGETLWCNPKNFTKKVKESSGS